MAKRKAKKTKRARKEEKPLTLDQRRAKIRARYEKPVVRYEDDLEAPRVPTRFVRLNGLLGGGIQKGAIIELFGWEDSAKAQPLDSQILTPQGWCRFGVLEVGDLVVGLDGRPTEVLGVYPQGFKDVFRVELSDGASTECSADHQWYTRTLRERELNHPGRVRPLTEIQETLHRGKNPNHSIPLVDPIEFSGSEAQQDLPLSPYLLGVLLGDGSFRSGNVTIHNSEQDIIESVLDELPEGDEGVVYQGHPGISLRITKPSVHSSRSTTLQVLEDLGLWGCGSFEKFVPLRFLRASVLSRRRLLRGLLDTDGTVCKPGLPGVSYSTSSERLCGDVVFLVRSLGGIATTSSEVPAYWYRGERREGRRSYRVAIQFPCGWRPISSAKHRKRWRKPELIRHRRIVGVSSLGSKECQCIRVANPDGLYVTDDFIVTHNTSTALSFAADIQAQAPADKRHVVMVNFEMPEDYEWWRRLGIDTAKEAFTQLRPKTLEEGVADAADLIESGEVCCVIYDSVYAASAKDSKEVLKTWQDPTKGGQSGKGGIGVEARQWGAAWTATKGLFIDYDVVCIAVNQMRVDPDVGGRPRKGYQGQKTTTPRGKALKFYSWIRVELSSSILVDEEGNVRKDVDGRRIRMRVIKNKTSDDQRGVAFYDIVRGYGFDLTGELIALSLEAGAIKHKGGGHYSCGPVKIRGKAKLRQWVEGSDRIRAILSNCVSLWLSKRTPQQISEGVVDG